MAENTWQPIETAPRVGLVLGFNGHFSTMVWVGNGWVDPRGFAVENPTHWMAIEPPEERFCIECGEPGVPYHCLDADEIGGGAA